MTTYLTRPEGNDGAEGEARLSLETAHFPEGVEHGDREGTSRAGLDLDLGHLQRAEGNVGEELGGRRTGEPDGTLVLVRGLLTSEVHVGVLEQLVETVLEHALEGVADESGAEALPETGRTLLSSNELQARESTLVLGRVDLGGQEQ